MAKNQLTYRAATYSSIKLYKGANNSMHAD